jgi:hypothetical protein
LSAPIFTQYLQRMVSARQNLAPQNRTLNRMRHTSERFPTKACAAFGLRMDAGSRQENASNKKQK